MLVDKHSKHTNTYVSFRFSHGQDTCCPRIHHLHQFFILVNLVSQSVRFIIFSKESTGFLWLSGLPWVEWLWRLSSQHDEHLEWVREAGSVLGLLLSEVNLKVSPGQSSSCIFCLPLLNSAVTHRVALKCSIWSELTDTLATSHSLHREEVLCF